MAKGNVAPKRAVSLGLHVREAWASSFLHPDLRIGCNVRDSNRFWTLSVGAKAILIPSSQIRGTGYRLGKCLQQHHGLLAAMAGQSTVIVSRRGASMRNCWDVDQPWPQEYMAWPFRAVSSRQRRTQFRPQPNRMPQSAEERSARAFLRSGDRRGPPPGCGPSDRLTPGHQFQLPEQYLPPPGEHSIQDT